MMLAALKLLVWTAAALVGVGCILAFIAVRSFKRERRRSFIELASLSSAMTFEDFNWDAIGQALHETRSEGEVSQ